MAAPLGREQTLELGPNGETRWLVTWVTPAGRRQGQELRAGQQSTCDTGAGLARLRFHFATDQPFRLWANDLAAGADARLVAIDPATVTTIHRIPDQEKHP